MAISKWSKRLIQYGLRGVFHNGNPQHLLQEVFLLVRAEWERSFPEDNLPTVNYEMLDAVKESNSEAYVLLKQSLKQ